MPPKKIPEKLYAINIEIPIFFIFVVFAWNEIKEEEEEEEIFLPQKQVV